MDGYVGTGIAYYIYASGEIRGKPYKRLKTLLLIWNKCTDVFSNLAAEEYLLKRYSQDLIMVWRNEPAVVIGKHQHVWEETDPPSMEREKINIARRYSGGGAVYHDLGNLNVSFFETGGMLNAEKFTGILRDFLNILGVKALIDDRNGLLVNGRKVSGSAQCVHRNRSLFHATLLFCADIEKLNQCLDPPAIKGDSDPFRRTGSRVKSVRTAVANLNGLTAKKMGMEEFTGRLVQYLTVVCHGIEMYDFSGEDTSAITFLRDSRYATHDWNFNAI